MHSYNTGYIIYNKYIRRIKQNFYGTIWLIIYSDCMDIAISIDGYLAITSCNKFLYERPSIYFY